MRFEGFQDGCHGGHLGYQNGTILAILTLHVAPMPSTKFPLHPKLGIHREQITIGTFKKAVMAAIMDRILMSKMLKATDGYTDEGRNMVKID